MPELPHESAPPHALRLVSVSADGSSLVLRDDDDARFTLEIDEALAAAVRNDRPRLGQLQIDTGELRPRDIQARIRAGGSVEEIAKASGLAPERVRRYAGPVLDERRHVVKQAQAAGLRGGAHEASGHGLGQIVSDHLEARGVDTGSLGWDAWRREDARWDVTVTYPAGESSGGGHVVTARFVFDAVTRFVIPDDEQSRWLVGRDEPSRLRGSGDVTDATDFDDSGDGAAGERPRPSHLSAVASLDSPAEPSTASDRPEPSTAAPGGRAPVRARRGARRAKRAEPSTRSETAARSERASTPPTAPTPPTPPTPDERDARGSARAAVPSWDEILFGATSKPDR